MMDYLALLEKAKARGNALLTDQTGWKWFPKSNEYITLECKPSDRLNCNIYRSNIHIRAPLEVVKDSLLFMPGGQRAVWEDNINEPVILKRINDHTLLYQSSSKILAKGLIAARESIDLATLERTEEGGYLAVGASVDCPDIPVPDNTVRAVTGLIYLRVFNNSRKPGFVHSVTITEIDPKGNIPKLLLDSVIPAMLFHGDGKWRKFVEKQVRSMEEISSS